MWWLIITIIIILVILLIVVAVVASSNGGQCPPPTPPCATNLGICDGKLILLSCGDEVQLKTCDSHGRIGNYQYYWVNIGQRTYVPFRPTKIQGDYKTCIITYGDEVDYAIIHKKDDGIDINLPTDYSKVNVVIY